MIRLLLNLLWAVIGGGALIALQYLLGGIILCLTIVGIPFGLQCFKLAQLSLFPFGKDIREDPASQATGTLGLAMNIIWIIFGGLTTFLTHVGMGLASAVTIIGIPFAMQHLKLAVLALFPFGREVVELD